MAASVVRGAAAAITVRAADPWASGVSAWLDASCERFYLARVQAPSGSCEHLLEARARASGALVGVLEGSSWFGGVYVSRLAVAEEWRRSRGVGRALLAALEREAREGPARARAAFLCTLDFQGVEYYPRLGFARQNTVEGLPGGRRVIYFAKKIGGDGGDGALASAALPAAAMVAASAAPSAAPAADAAAAFDIVSVPALALPEPGREERTEAANSFLREVFADYSRASVGMESGWFAFAFEAVAEVGEGSAAPSAPSAPAPATGGAAPQTAPADAGHTPSAELRVGAISGMAYFGLLVIQLVSVEPAYRSRGAGTGLVQAALALGRARGCTRCVVETMTFQAPRFYERLGFSEVARVEGFQQGSALVRLVRTLDE